MTDQELKDLVAGLTVAQAETGQQLKETDRQLKELGKQIGGLGQKFGGFTEGLALPSMEKILRERFHMNVVAPSVRVWRDDRAMHLDVLAYSEDSIDEVYVVEVKSHLRQDGIDQILKTLRNFPDFFPQHRGKKLFGILAAVDAPIELCRKVLEQGLYLARISGDVFELKVPDDFVPRIFENGSRAA